MQEMFVREKAIECGKHYKEIDIFTYTESQANHNKRKGVRAKKEKVSEPKQKNLNEKNARRYFIQLVNKNFGNDRKNLFITLTYNAQNLPQTLADAEKEVTNFLRRVDYARKKEKLPKLKYIVVTEYEDTEGNEIRIHHHIMMNHGLPRSSIETLWSKKKKIIGCVNVQTLFTTQADLFALCYYLIKQERPHNKKKWTSSHNLEKPTSKTNDFKFSKRQIEKWAKAPPFAGFWERKYKGWTPVEDCGVKFEFNEVTAQWSIYLKLRKKDRRIKNENKKDC